MALLTDQKHEVCRTGKAICSYHWPLQTSARFGSFTFTFLGEMGEGKLNLDLELS